MIVNAMGVVLSRRDWREADRLAVVFTEGHGKLPVRFVGVNKAGRKLKALSEPLVLAEFRLYLSARSEFAKAVGGQLVSSFPAVRRDLRRTLAALSCCEMLAEMTPWRAPSAAKYRLIGGALAGLEEREDPEVVPAFGRRLLELAGYGAEGLADDGVRERIESITGRPLRCPVVAEKMRTYATEEAPC